MNRLSWPPIVERAAEIVDSYDTGVTLRQLFYRPVAEQVLPNTESAYESLSARTAEASTTSKTSAQEKRATGAAARPSCRSCWRRS